MTTALQLLLDLSMDPRLLIHELKRRLHLAFVPLRDFIGHLPVPEVEAAGDALNRDEHTGFVPRIKLDPG